MTDGYHNDHNIGQSSCSCFKNSDCILTFKVDVDGGQLDFLNSSSQWESVNLKTYSYKWAQNTTAKKIQLLADSESSGRNIEFLLLPKECISDSSDCPLAIIYEIKESQMLMDSYTHEYIALKGGVIQEESPTPFTFYTIDLKRYFQEKTNELIEKGSVEILGISIHANIIKNISGQEDSFKAIETLLKKRLLFALVESLITGKLDSFPHTSFHIHVLECAGIQGKYRRIPMSEGNGVRNVESSSTLSSLEAEELRHQSSGVLLQAPALGQNSLVIELDVFPTISFEYGVQGEIDIANFIARARGVPSIVSPPMDASQTVGNDKTDSEEQPIFYTIYNGKDDTDNVVDEMAFDPLDVREDLADFIKKIVPFVSTFDILDLMVTYIKNFTPNNPRPLFRVKALPPKFVIRGSGHFRENSDGGIYVHPYGELTTSPLLGAELKIDMLQALVLMIPGGILLDYFLRYLETMQVAYQEGDSPFYINAHVDLYIAPAINLALSYEYHEPTQTMEMAFLGNEEFEVGVRFFANISGAFVLSKVFEVAFELSFKAEFKARLGLDKKADGGGST